MSDSPIHRSGTPSEAFRYFVLSYCILVPTVGTIAWIILTNQMSEELALAGIACVYLSSIVLGMPNVKRFKDPSERAEFWVLVSSITLSAVSLLVAVGAMILYAVAVGTHIH